MQGEHGKMNKRRPLVQAVAPVEKVSITAGVWRSGSMWKVTRANPPPRCEIRVRRRWSAGGRCETLRTRAA